MAESFQKERPRGRVNFFLEVKKEGATVREELPLRMLVLGKFSGEESDIPFEDRDKVSINKNNFDDVMKESGLRLDFTVADMIRDPQEGEERDEKRVELKFDRMKSFNPDEVAKQVPDLNRLVAVRNLLQDLRNRLVSGKQFRKELERIVKDKDALEKLKRELEPIITSEE